MHISRLVKSRMQGKYRIKVSISILSMTVTDSSKYELNPEGELSRNFLMQKRVSLLFEISLRRAIYLNVITWI